MSEIEVLQPKGTIRKGMSLVTFLYFANTRSYDFCSFRYDKPLCLLHVKAHLHLKKSEKQGNMHINVLLKREITYCKNM